jgi:uncharacterized OB-fold protein
MEKYIDFSKGPLPDLEDSEVAPFWEATRQGEIRFPKCLKCNRFHWYPCVLCPFCHSSDIEWQAVKGKAKVYTWTHVRWDLGPLYHAQGPYIVAYVEFSDAPGAHLVTNLVDCKPEDAYIGMPVEVVFQQINDEVAMPLVKPVSDKSS